MSELAHVEAARQRLRDRDRARRERYRGLWERAASDSLVIIDFPQAVDPRQNSRAFELLHRDIGNVCSYWEQYGVRESAFDIAHDLWQRRLYGRL